MKEEFFNNIETHGEVRGSSVSGEFVEARGTSDLAWRELRPYYLYTDTIFGIDIKLCKTSDFNIQFAIYIRGNTYTDETDKLGTLYTTIEFFRRQEDQKVLRPKQYNLSAPLRPAIIYEYDGYVYLRIFRFTSASTFQISFYTSKRSLTIGTQDFIWSEELPEGAVKLHEFDVKNQYMMSIDYNTVTKPELTGELAKPVDVVIPYLVHGVNWLRDNMVKSITNEEIDAMF